MNQTDEKSCPRCHAPEMKSWNDLNDEEKMLAGKLAASANFTPEEREKHRFCVRCWYEDEHFAADLKHC